MYTSGVLNICLRERRIPFLVESTITEFLEKSTVLVHSSWKVRIPWMVSLWSVPQTHHKLTMARRMHEVNIKSMNGSWDIPNLRVMNDMFVGELQPTGWSVERRRKGKKNEKGREKRIKDTNSNQKSRSSSVKTRGRIIFSLLILHHSFWASESLQWNNSTGYSFLEMWEKRWQLQGSSSRKAWWGHVAIGLAFSYPPNPDWIEAMRCVSALKRRTEETEEWALSCTTRSSN